MRDLRKRRETGSSQLSDLVLRPASPLSILLDPLSPSAPPLSFFPLDTQATLPLRPRTRFASLKLPLPPPTSFASSTFQRFAKVASPPPPPFQPLKSLEPAQPLSHFYVAKCIYRSTASLKRTISNSSPKVDGSWRGPRGGGGEGAGGGCYQEFVTVLSFTHFPLPHLSASPGLSPISDTRKLEREVSRVAVCGCRRVFS